jgi:hypothetical protein
MLRFACMCLISLWLCCSASAKEARSKISEAMNKAQYLALISQRAAKTYFPLQDFAACKASIKFAIAQDGRLSNIKVEEHPRDWKTLQAAQLADSALIQSILNLHLPPPPKDLEAPVTVRTVFDGRVKGPMKILSEVIAQDDLSGKPPKAGQTLGTRTSP